VSRRYAHDILDLAAGYRRVVGLHVAMLEVGAGDHEAEPLRRAVAELAQTWLSSMQT